MLRLVKLDKERHKFLSFIEDHTGQSKSVLVEILIDAGLKALMDPEELPKDLADKSSPLSELTELLSRWKEDGILIVEKPKKI
jgi:hypothetical protein